MPKKFPIGTMQRIQDKYEAMGYSGERLRKALESDKEWQRIIEERRNLLSKKFDISPAERKRFVMSTDDDYEILGRIKRLENAILGKHHRRRYSMDDEDLLKLLKSQLQYDWRPQLLRFLKKMEKKYAR